MKSLWRSADQKKVSWSYVKRGISREEEESAALMMNHLIRARINWWDEESAVEMRRKPMRREISCWDEESAVEMRRKPMRREISCWDEESADQMRNRLMRRGTGWWDEESADETRNQLMRRGTGWWDEESADEGRNQLMTFISWSDVDRLRDEKSADDLYQLLIRCWGPRLDPLRPSHPPSLVRRRCCPRQPARWSAHLSGGWPAASPHLK